MFGSYARGKRLRKLALSIDPDLLDPKGSPCWANAGGRRRCPRALEALRLRWRL
jgi:hypothetical protein